MNKSEMKKIEVFAAKTVKKILKHDHMLCGLCGECRECGRDVGRHGVNHRRGCSLRGTIPACKHPAVAIVADKRKRLVAICRIHLSRGLRRHSKEFMPIPRRRIFSLRELIFSSPVPE